MMKTRSLAAATILLCSFVLAPSLLRADPNEWYQGRPGQWVQQQNQWRFRDNKGGEEPQDGKNWRWDKTPAPNDHRDPGRPGPPVFWLNPLIGKAHTRNPLTPT